VQIACFRLRQRIKGRLIIFYFFFFVVVRCDTVAALDACTATVPCLHFYPPLVVYHHRDLLTRLMS
jgi:hypothetical protein